MAETFEKTARDIMLDVFAFPHIPYWFTLRQAVGILKNSLLKEEGTLQPAVVLVFDEKYNLVGFLGLADLLRGLKPLCEGGEGDAAPPGAPPAWKGRAVSEFMAPVAACVEPDAPLGEAALQLIQSGMALLPVLEHRKKLVGVIRAREIFRELSGLI